MHPADYMNPGRRLLPGRAARRRPIWPYLMMIVLAALAYHYWGPGLKSLRPPAVEASVNREIAMTLNEVDNIVLDARQIRSNNTQAVRSLQRLRAVLQRLDSTLDERFEPLAKSRVRQALRTVEEALESAANARDQSQILHDRVLQNHSSERTSP